MALRVGVVAYRRLMLALLGGAAALAAYAAVLFAGGAAGLGAAVMALAIACAAATFGVRLRGDLRGETLLLLTRQECAVCDEARRLLAAWQDEFGYGVWVVDVDEASQGVRDEATARVPVIMHRGRVLAELDVRADELRRALEGT